MYIPFEVELDFQTEPRFKEVWFVFFTQDQKSAITSLQFNWNDTVIASGADNGDIVVYNVVTAMGSSPLRAPKTQVYTELFNFASKNDSTYNVIHHVCLTGTNKY